MYRSAIRRYLPTSSDLSAHKVALYVGVGFFSFVFGFPIYWVLISAIKPGDDITDYPPQLIPSEVTAENFVFLLNQTPFLFWLKNSLVISFGNVVLSVILASVAAYGLTRYRLYGKKGVARALIFSYMFPSLMLGIPYYFLWFKAGLLNTYTGVILSHTSVTLPFATWLMWQFFQTVPIAWEESAWTMGAPRYKTMFEIAMPGAMPGIAAISVFAFGVSWSDFTFAFILLSEPKSQVLTTGVTSFAGGMQIYWGALMAGAAALIIPPLLLVLFLNKYILAGFTISGFD